MPRPITDITGEVFGNLIVVEITSSRAADGSVVWKCQCVCGNSTTASATNLKSKNTKSCGCLQVQHQTVGSITHGHSSGGGISDTYMTWANMIQRCTNPNHTAWKDYGGRGITVCDRWMIFENFLQDMGERPEGLIIDREENNQGYVPGNCRWVTYKVSANNTRKNRK